MLRIGLISDTHHFLDENVFRHSMPAMRSGMRAISALQTWPCVCPLLNPCGSYTATIDGQDIRSIYPEKLRWTSEGVNVYMTHIGGYPPRYNPAVKKS